MFYVYIHKKADTGEVFYVGKGQGNRAYGLNSRNRYWRAIVNKHGFTAVIIKNYKSEEEAHKKEIALISKFRSLDIELVNMTDGGDGTSGCNHPKKVRNKISESKTGKKQSKEHRRKNSEVRKGIPRSEETKKRISDTMKKLLKNKPSWHHNPSFEGRTHSEETKAIIREKRKFQKFSKKTRRKLSEANKRRYAK